GPRPHQAAVLPARRHALRGRHPARRRRQRRQPHHPRFPSRAPGIPEEMTGALRQPGAILLVSCYEPGHQPLGLAWPRAFLEQAGYAPETLDLAVEPFDADKARRARLVAISVPMHTALRLGVRAAEQVRRLNGSCRIVFHGLYALLNGEHLSAHGADAVLRGQVEQELVALVRRWAAGEEPAITPRATLARVPFPAPSRDGPPT